jgi:hypothetical protein
MPKWPRPTYEIRATLHAPLAFVYRWCTDFSTGDASLEGEEYERRVLERSARRVVFEDLQSTPDGWRWARHVIALHPPDRWHSDSVGNYREASIDYRLVDLPSNRTELILRMRRRPVGLGVRNPSKREFEAATARGWRSFDRALVRDYKRRAKG